MTTALLPVILGLTVLAQPKTDASSEPTDVTFDASPAKGMVPLTVYFDASPVRSADDSDFDWNFGDGQRGAGLQTSHTYEASGDFDVTLTVTDKDGNQTAFKVRQMIRAEPNFQPYIFWAYGFVCALLFIFTLWTVGETKRVGRHVEYLKERFESAHGNEADKQKQPE